jgi:hypothetical protein
MKKLLAIIPLLLLAAGCNLNSAVTNSTATTGDIIMYPVQCNDWFPSNYSRGSGDNNSNEPQGDARNFRNCLQRRALDRTTYNINASTQQVIQEDPDLANSGFSKDTDCTVIDLNNWSCDDGAMQNILGFGFKNDVPFDNEYTHIVLVDESQWSAINNGSPSPISQMK